MIFNKNVKTYLPKPDTLLVIKHIYLIFLGRRTRTVGILWLESRNSNESDDTLDAEKVSEGLYMEQGSSLVGFLALFRGDLFRLLIWTFEKPRLALFPDSATAAKRAPRRT